MRRGALYNAQSPCHREPRSSLPLRLREPSQPLSFWATRANASPHANLHNRLKTGLLSICLGDATVLATLSRFMVISGFILQQFTRFYGYNWRRYILHTCFSSFVTYKYDSKDNGTELTLFTLVLIPSSTFYKIQHHRSQKVKD